MDLQARKLSLIDWLLHLEDEALINQLEEMYNDSIHPEAVSNKEMLHRHLESIKDIQAGNVIDNDSVRQQFGL